MSVKIIKSGEQKKQEVLANRVYCPECGEYRNLGWSYIKATGFLGMGNKYKVTTYNCVNCGCEYEKRELI